MNVLSKSTRVRVEMAFEINLPFEQLPAASEYRVIANVSEMVLQVSKAVQPIIAISACQV